MIHKVTKVEPISPTIDFTKRDSSKQYNSSNSNHQSQPDDSNLSFQQVLEKQQRLLEEKSNCKTSPDENTNESDGKRLTLTRKVPKPNRNLGNQN